MNSVLSIPRNDAGPVFSAPWQAEIFAITLILYEQEIFSWIEWSEMLRSKINDAQDDGDPDLGDTYYHHWLAALEQMIVDKGVGDTAQLEQLYEKSYVL